VARPRHGQPGDRLGGREGRTSLKPDAPLTQHIVDACLAMGFACAGVAPAQATAYRAELLDWLAAGKHGEMSYLGELLDERLDVGVMLPGARAVIIVADRYAEGGVDGEPAAGEPRGRIARYARGEDYHRVIKRRLRLLADRLGRLHPLAEFRSFVDTGPVLEREHAARAGLGGAFIGKHTLLIHPRLGSYLLLGGIATTLDLVPSELGSATPTGCGGCTRCIDACPTQAITPYAVDARRCVSYLTLEHAGMVDEGLAAGMADWLVGCDICQEVCPYNAPGRGAGAGVNPAYSGAGGPGASLPILDVLGWNEAARSATLSRSAAKRATLAMLKRSAVIAAGKVYAKTRDARVLDALRRIAGDATESAVVRATAERVLGRIDGGGSAGSAGASAECG